MREIEPGDAHGDAAVLPGKRSLGARKQAGLLATCGNARCTSGWFHPLRSRSGPFFEGLWSCSATCTAAQVESAIRREMEGAGGKSITHRHRVPLGLVMLEQGWITSEQLRTGLESQRTTGAGKLGRWLIEEQGISEQLVTRALGLQWSCPVLSLDLYDPESMSVTLPRLFVEAFAALPLRIAGGKILYLGFEDRLDPVVALALERMLGLHVEAGVVRGSLFEPAHQQLLHANFPRADLIESASEAPLVRVLSRAIERSRPVEARLVRVHDCLWLRMWLRPQTGPLPEPGGVEDVLCSMVRN
jgi:hypothetical protein